MQNQPGPIVLTLVLVGAVCGVAALAARLRKGRPAVESYAIGCAVVGLSAALALAIDGQVPAALAVATMVGAPLPLLKLVVRDNRRTRGKPTSEQQDR